MPSKPARDLHLLQPGDMSPVEAAHLLGRARALQDPAWVGRVLPLRGKYIALLCEVDDSDNAIAFRHAAMELGARVPRSVQATLRHPTRSITPRACSSAVRRIDAGHGRSLSARSPEPCIPLSTPRASAIRRLAGPLSGSSIGGEQRTLLLPASLRRDPNQRVFA